jgi:hypothetical protein
MRQANANAKIEIRDETTGEILQGVPAFVQKKARNGFDLGWSQLRFVNIESGKDAPGESIMNGIARMNQTDARVMLGLLFVNGYRNEVTVDLDEFTSVLGLSKPNLYRSFRSLMKSGFLERGEDGKGWAICESVMWRGRGREHLKIVESQREETN